MTELSLPATGTLREQLSARKRRTRSVFLAHDPEHADKLAKAREVVQIAKIAADQAMLTAGVSTGQEAKALIPGFPSEPLDVADSDEMRANKMRRISLEVAVELSKKLDAAIDELSTMLNTFDVWEFEFRTIGFTRRRQLEDAAPPTDEEIEEAKANQRAIAELNRNVPKERQTPVPRLPTLSLASLAMPLICEALSAVRRWPQGQDGDPVEFADVPDRELIEAMFDDFGWTAADRGAMFDAAYIVDVEDTAVDWEAVGKD